jgi:hypothetical protein
VRAVASFRVAVWALAIAGTAPLARGASPCDVSYPSDALVEWDCHRVGKGETLESLFTARWHDAARFNRIDRRHVYAGSRVRKPRSVESIVDFTPMPAVYEPATEVARFLLIELTEQFAGAYEHGRLVLSLPIASGRHSNPTPSGEFRITAFHRDHVSSLYTVEGTRRPYPMNFGLRFHTSRSGVAYWIHGRDMPGYPASHGCIGLFDEAMQKRVYGNPKDPLLDDARRLYEWVIGDLADDGSLREIEGPRVRIVGAAPRPARGR